MNKEDLNLYEDGNPVNESEVATAVGKLSDAVLFQDDGGSLYFLKADPDAFELGTIARKSRSRNRRSKWEQMGLFCRCERPLFQIMMNNKKECLI